MRTNTNLHYNMVIALTMLVSCQMISCFTTSQPRWVRQHPVDTQYYTGIGIANKIPGQSDHTSRAREMALYEIASNIATSIISESNLQIVQEAGIHRETFIANITTTTQAGLEGFELVDTWENPREYRAYYRLSKLKHKDILEHRLQHAALRVGHFYSEGRKAELAGDVIQAISFYLQATSEIGDYWGYGLPKPGASGNEYIDLETYMRLITLLNNVSIDADPRLVQAGFLEAPGQQVNLHATYVDPFGEKVVLSGLPLKTEFKQGKASTMNLENTGKDGISRLFIQRAESIGFTEIEILADLHRIAGTSDGYSHTVFEGLPKPSVTVTLKVLPVTVRIVADELNLGKKAARPVTAEIVSQALTEGGWVITNNIKEADFLITINASSRIGTERMGIHTAFAEGQFSLMRSDNREEIFSLSNSQVNAGSRDYETAGKLALERLAEWFISELNRDLFSYK
jgi:hypothetical protein